ncbi:MAG: shikimate dehydrogenase [Eubacteriales bacterium]|nr:shikimate dehydrogenase [Eubacteriales bacterium]
MSKNYRAELTGVFGDPVDDNPTGVVEEAGFQAAGLNYRYLTIRITDGELESAMAAVRALHMKGINLTMPHKVKVLPLLDELSKAASIIGAVNTVIQKDGRLYGENTDGKGFLKALMDNQASPQDKVITILGAGGAARAIAVECALAGAKHIHVVNRTPEKGRELAALILEKTPASADFLPWTGSFSIPKDTDILIQATNIGLAPDVKGIPDLDFDSITPDMAASDVVFNPPDTPFLKEAAKRGAKTINGLGMLVNQAALNFTLWTDTEAPYDVMYNALKKEFEEN